MNKKDKIIIIFYIFLAVSYVSAMMYTDREFGNVKLSTEQSKEVKEITLVKTVSVNKTKLFDTFSDVENYPTILPNNIVSVKILNKSSSVIYTEDILEEKFVKTTVIVKHTIIPYQSQTMEVTDGDAQGTIVVLSFKGNGSGTTLTTDVMLHLHGILAPFVFFPSSSLQDELDKKITAFTDYAKGFDSKYEKIVDDLYRKILYRPADPIGLKYFASQLESGKMTISDIQITLLESDEAKHALSPAEIKTIDELNSTTRNTIDNLYQTILHRPADPQGMQYFGSEFESGKMTISDIQITLLASDEAKHALSPAEIKTIDELNSTTRNTIDNLYQTILHRPADPQGMQYFGSELESGKMTISDISKALSQSEEGQNIELTYDPARKMITDLYIKIFHRPVDNQTLDHYVPLLQSRNMTYNQIEKEFLAKSQSSSNP